MLECWTHFVSQEPQGEFIAVSKTLVPVLSSPTSPLSLYSRAHQPGPLPAHRQFSAFVSALLTCIDFPAFIPQTLSLWASGPSPSCKVPFQTNGPMILISQIFRLPLGIDLQLVPLPAHRATPSAVGSSQCLGCPRNKTLGCPKVLPSTTQCCPSVLALDQATCRPIGRTNNLTRQHSFSYFM